MIRKSMKYVLVCNLALVVFPSAVFPIDFVRVDLGIRQIPMEYPCPLRLKTTQWATTDWFTGIIVQEQNISERDRATIEVTVPNGRIFKRVNTWSGSYRRGCDYLFIPILGTDAEDWQGRWRAVVLLNDRKVSEVSWEIVGPREGALAEYQKDLEANPQKVWAHYQVGATAALIGQDPLAESELKEAAHLDPTWWYPYLALGRLYQRQGRKELAADNFNMLRGLLLGKNADPGTFVEYIEAMLNDHLEHLEK